MRSTNTAVSSVAQSLPLAGENEVPSAADADRYRSKKRVFTTNMKIRTEAMEREPGCATNSEIFVIISPRIASGRKPRSSASTSVARFAFST